MKKILITGFVLVIGISILNAQKPEQVYSIANVYKQHGWYLNQVELWWKEIQKDQKNETAWYNFFMANKMASFEFDNHGDKKKRYYEETKFQMNPDSIVSQIQRYIPNTFTSYYVIWRNFGSTSKDFPHLEKAYSINPNFPRINAEMVCYYETQYDLAKRKEFNKKWYQLNELSSNILAYSYNVLMTIKQNGAIITYGDNDTFPIWMLQDALGVREDITVLNVSLLVEPEYREKIFRKLNIPPYAKNLSASSCSGEDIFNHILESKPGELALYIGLPAWKQLKDVGNNFYLVGLTLEYSTNNIDNLALLKNNFENKYALDYIKNSFIYDVSNDLVNKINLNYLPGIFKLFEHYTLSGNLSQAQKMKELGLLIAQKGGQDWLDKASSILK